MKRFVSLLLLLTLLLTFCIPVLAADSTYSLLLHVDGQSAASVSVKHEVTVSLVLAKEGNAEFELYSFQDYICFDPNAFQYVEGSLQVPVLDGLGNPLLLASPLSFYASGTGPVNRIFVNRASSTAASLPSDSVLLTFRLKALHEGDTALTHDAVELFQKVGAPDSVTEKTAQVTITAAKHSGSGTGGGGGGSGAAALPPQPEEPQPEEIPLPFVDVEQTDWFYSAVRLVYEKGLLTGTSADRFQPNVSMNRAMLVTVLHRLEQKPQAKLSDFSDVDRTSWFAPAVGWAAETGMADGYPDGRFGPNDPITREQMAALLYRYVASKQVIGDYADSLSQFSDNGQVSPWATDAMRWAVGAELIAGKENGRLDPQGPATRAEVAAILMRYLRVFS